MAWKLRGGRALAGALILTAGIIASLSVWMLLARDPLPLEPDDRIARVAPSALAATLVLPANDRPVYPYSIIPGGVESVDELKQAMANDPVVAKHFAAFDLSKARVETLQQPRVAHVSYRRGQDVFWTAKPVVIPAGERVITDGTNTARVRCANCVADRPGAVSATEPSPETLDRPESPDLRLASAGDPSDPGVGSNPGPSTPGGGVPGDPGSGSSGTPGGGGTPGVGGPGGGSGGPSGGGSPVGMSGGSLGAGEASPGLQAKAADGGESPDTGGSPGIGGTPGSGSSPGGGPGSAGPGSGPGTGSGGTTPGHSGSPAGPGSPGDVGTPPGTSSVPSLFPPGGSPGGAPWLPPGSDLKTPAGWPPSGDPLTPPGGMSSPPGPDDPLGPGDPGDADDPRDSDDTKTVPEPGTTALMLAGAAWMLRRKLSAR